jgi:hypothetical protein
LIGEKSCNSSRFQPRRFALLHVGSERQADPLFIDFIGGVRVIPSPKTSQWARFCSAFHASIAWPYESVFSQLYRSVTNKARVQRTPFAQASFGWYRVCAPLHQGSAIGGAPWRRLTGYAGKHQSVFSQTIR